MEANFISDLSACVFDRWSPRIGDPTIMGWVTVTAYFLTACACFMAGRVRMRDGGFWLFLFVILLFLGVNKQFDLQSALTAAGRCISQMQGWYEDRRQFQFFFIIALMIVFGVVFLFAFGKMFGRLDRVGIALFGFGILLTFVAIRAVGFHHFDEMIGSTFVGARVNWILELSGVFLILLNALAAIKGRRREQRQRGATGAGH